MTASGSPGQAATVGTVGELVEAAARALGAFGLYDEDERRAATAVLAAVLPLLADAMEAKRAELPALLYANDPGHSHDNGLRRAAALLRDLAERVAR